MSIRDRQESGSASGVSRRTALGAAAAALAAVVSPRAGLASPADETARARVPYHLGLASYTCRKFDLDHTLAMARRVGLERICLKSFHMPLEATPAETAAVAEKVRKAGLTLYGGGVITLGNPRQVDQAFAYAKAAGMGMIVAAPTAEALPLVDEKVKATGIVVAIHNHGPTDKHFPTPASVYEAIDKLDPRIGLCIDIGHTVRVGADLIGSVRKYADRLFDLHMKDVTAAKPEGKGIEVGRGIIDIPGLMRALVQAKYQGVVSFEYEEQADDPLPGLAESVGYVRGVVATM